MDVAQARELARSYLAAPLPRRWRHVEAVAASAEYVAGSLRLPRQSLVSAAWLHDIGYSPQIVETGLHPLDGARFLRRQGVGEDVVLLVAHHSCATVEADERGLDHELLAEFPHEVTPLADALLYCDMTTGPSGETVAVPARLAEIRARYGPDHVVTRFTKRAASSILAAAGRTEQRLRDAGAAF